ncbi:MULTISPECIES: DUF6228 family protein [Vibrio]|uniref:Uncharacterized protein n=1 Tax=Vibrio campbellii TaxID=680 RepID=A0ABY5IJU2_9VIBR|nr:MULTISPECIES: DUF6228 family protein [Vibrio]AXB31532.1 hypothetical protein DSB67_08120 [Vibrio campbellii]NOI94713.1 hypothetical protein [Vibrio sp. T3Y01]UTZ23539.1 hypothetical protein HB760_17020 [Vibrio campbellii]UTZ34314.1 hypothetical protein HB762_24345 [Vibrio campbellii]|tara:strand:+ start:35 stop:436 length:402 start_codon:yes stop_codon:yes gene_type:complete
MKIISDNQLIIEFHRPEFNLDGWMEHYTLSLSGRGMTSSVRVVNQPYGDGPSDFFKQLAEEWQGWDGEKVWSSLEGEYSMSAKSDLTGHVYLNFQIYSNLTEPYWSVQVVIILETGQLDSIATRLSEYLWQNC